MQPISLCPLLDEYLNLVDDTESPTLYHRWCLLTSVGALLNRRTRFEMATGSVYPNMFTILLGPPGARKSTAISMSARILKQAGYRHIANGTTSAEQFLLDLKLGFDAIRVAANDLETLALDVPQLLTAPCSHVLVQAGELQDFLGTSNVTFLTKLTNLWDNPEDYPYRLKSGTMELINKPTISLLGGATQTTFKKMFPLDVIGQGLLSRFMLIHGAGPRKRVFMPKPLDASLEAEIVEYLKVIGRSPEIPSNYEYTPAAEEFSRVLYESGETEITDLRFQHYANRRNDHYMKLAIIIASMNLHQKIELNDCILANTILTYTEKFMPLALGEFGLDHNAEKTEYLYNLIQRHTTGMSIPELVTQSLSVFNGNTSELASHITKLKAAKRIDQINRDGKIHYIVIERTVASNSGLVDFNLLHEYRENPTFNTAYHASPERANEFELSALLEQAANSNPDLKKSKRKSTAIQLPTFMNGDNSNG